MARVTTLRSRTRRRARPRRSHAERTAQTRALLMDAVVESIAEVGLARTTAPEIARRAGVTWGAVQHHFGGKDGMLVSVLDDSFRRFAEGLEGIPLEGTSPREARVALHRPGLGALRQRPLSLDPRDPDPLPRARGHARQARLARPHVPRLGSDLAPPVRRRAAAAAGATIVLQQHTIAVLSGLASTLMLEGGEPALRPAVLELLKQTLARELAGGVRADVAVEWNAEACRPRDGCSQRRSDLPAAPRRPGRRHHAEPQPPEPGQRPLRGADRRAAGGARRGRRRRGRPRRGDRRRGPRLLRRPRPRSRCGRIRNAATTRRSSARCRRLMIDAARDSAARDREGPGARHGGRLSAGRELRPRGGRQRRALRDVGDQRRALLRDARGPALARCLPQARLRDVDDGRIHRRRDRARLGPREPRRARRTSSTPRSPRWRARSRPSRASPWRPASACSTGSWR